MKPISNKKWAKTRWSEWIYQPHDEIKKLLATTRRREIEMNSDLKWAAWDFWCQFYSERSEKWESTPKFPLVQAEGCAIDTPLTSLTRTIQSRTPQKSIIRDGHTAHAREAVLHARLQAGVWRCASLAWRGSDTTVISTFCHRKAVYHLWPGWYSTCIDKTFKFICFVFF